MRKASPKFAAAIAASGLSQRELAIKAEVSPTTISNLLRRRFDADLETADAIAQALGVPVADLGLEISKRSISMRLVRKAGATC